MRLFFDGSSRLGLVALSLVLASCGGLDAEGTGTEASLAAQDDALSQAKASPAARREYFKDRAFREFFEGQRATGLVTQAELPTTETLQEYAAKCEDATGIRIPAFSCENGVEVGEGTERVDLTGHLIGISVGSKDLAGLVTTLTARGTDIQGTSDQFYFARIPSTPTLVTGDGSIEVKVRAVTNTDPYTKAGVMFRSSTAANATNVSIFITPGHGVSFQRRTTSGGATTTTELAGRAAPTWLRLTRSGNNFTGFASPDRVTWTQVGPSVTISGFPTAPLAGVALTSHNANVTATASFETLRWMANPMALCDRPNVLNRECDPGSKFQLLAQTGDAVAVAHCRKQGWGTGRYGDIAVIQYNKVTGGICFYQALRYDRQNQPIDDGNGLDGTNVPAPIASSTASNFRWYNPAETYAVGCPQCHDSGGFIRSPYLVQTGLLPNMEDGYDNYTPVSWVGTYFAQERSWAIETDNAPGDTGASCTTCHRLSVNNFAPDKGTGADFAKLATNQSQANDATELAKNPHSITSPIWMRRGQITFNQGAFDTAAKFRECATGFWRGPNNSVLPHHFTNGNRTTPGCDYSNTPVGQAWLAAPFNPVNIGITNGTLTQNGTVKTLTAAGSDINGTSDQFFFALSQAAPNGMATVKVNSLTNTHAFAKAGLMFRSHIGANAVNVMVDVTPTSGAQFQYRLVEGGATTSSTPLTPRAAPAWLRLFKTGSVVSGWVSNDNLTWNQVAPAVDAPNLSGDIGLAATSHNTALSTTAVFDRFSWVPSDDALADANIGLLSGTNTLSAGNRLITVAGADIFGTSDQFFYSFRQIQATGIRTKINSLTNTNAFAKAGVMIRSSINPNAAHVMIHVTPSSGVQFQYRMTDGATAVSNTPISGLTAPIWLRLARATGNVFTGYYSTDGTTWTTAGTVTIPTMPTTRLHGVAVTSHNATTATTASVGNVFMY